MRRLFVPSLAALALAACGGTADHQIISGIKEELRPLTTVAGAPTDRVAANSTLTMSSPPQALGVFDGRAAIGTGAGLFAASNSQPDTVAEVPVYLDGTGIIRTDTAATTGSVQLLARRGTEGTLAVTDKGLFHNQDGVLVRSPLSDTLAGKQLLGVDVYGSGASEELWLLAADGLHHVGNQQLVSISISGVNAKPEAALATGASRALVALDGALYDVDLTAGTAVLIHKGLGHVTAAERSEDGELFFATDTGLLEVNKAGELRLHTLAADGAPAQAISTVTAAYGSLVVGTASELYALEPAGVFHLGSVAGLTPRGVAIDANGDTFAAGTAGMLRFKTGKPVSFATDVKPFFTQHCMSCHQTGINGAPAINFTDYETARTWSAEALKRLNAVSVSPMPPTSAETLTAADYAVVTRWVGGGMAP